MGCKGAAPVATAPGELEKAQADLTKANARISELEKGVAPQPKYKWVMASTYPKGFAAQGVLEVFADLVEYYSKGAIKIDRFYGGALGDSPELIEKAKAGTVTFGWIFPYTSVNKKFVIVGGVGLPTSFMGLELLNQPYYNGINARISKEAWEEVGLRLLVSKHGVGSVLYMADKPVRTPADAKGLKIRVHDNVLALEALKNMGFSPVVLAAGEVYSALKTKTIDGYSHLLSTGPARTLWEVAKYAVDLPWWMDFESVGMNKKAYDDLPADLKEVVDRAATYASMYTGAWDEATEKDALKVIQQKGMTYIALTPAEKKAFWDVMKAEELWDKYVKPSIGDTWYNEWKSEVLRIRELYG